MIWARMYHKGFVAIKMYSLCCRHFNPLSSIPHPYAMFLRIVAITCLLKVMQSKAGHRLFKHTSLFFFFKLRRLFTSQHNATSQQTWIFSNNTVTTSNATLIQYAGYSYAHFSFPMSVRQSYYKQMQCILIEHIPLC